MSDKQTRIERTLRTALRMAEARIKERIDATESDAAKRLGIRTLVDIRECMELLDAGNKPNEGQQ